MANINPIQFGVINSNPLRQEQNTGLETNGNNNNPAPAENRNVSDENVLGYMSAQNSDLVPTSVKRTVNVSDYVTPEDAARIAAMMQNFTDTVDEVSTAALEEFPDLSEEAATAIALEYMNA